MHKRTIVAAVLLLSVGLLAWVATIVADNHETQIQQADELPQVTGAWVGTWGVLGQQKKTQPRLDCQVVMLESGKWQATFEGECGRPYKYTIEMLGRQAGKVVLFKGSVDLGKEDGGVYDWIGRATTDKFVGFYTSERYVGTFEMTRQKEASSEISTKAYTEPLK